MYNPSEGKEYSECMEEAYENALRVSLCVIILVCSMILIAGTLVFLNSEFKGAFFEGLTFLVSFFYFFVYIVIFGVALSFLFDAVRRESFQRKNVSEKIREVRSKIFRKGILLGIVRWILVGICFLLCEVGFALLINFLFPLITSPILATLLSLTCLGLFFSIIIFLLFFLKDRIRRYLFRRVTL
ncbi:MAG: hypothetical protein ACTSYM_08360 [Candidatus Baldrarchaeia archaeon]